MKNGTFWMMIPLINVIVRKYRFCFELTGNLAPGSNFIGMFFELRKCSSCYVGYFQQATGSRSK